jgi:hypothetical protein
LIVSAQIQLHGMPDIDICQRLKADVDNAERPQHFYSIPEAVSNEQIGQLLALLLSVTHQTKKCAFRFVQRLVQNTAALPWFGLFANDCPAVNAFVSVGALNEVTAEMAKLFCHGSGCRAW